MDEPRRYPKLAQHFLGPKKIIFKDESDIDVVVEWVIIMQDTLVAVVDEDGNVFNWDIIGVLKNNKPKGEACGSTAEN